MTRDMIRRETSLWDCRERKIQHGAIRVLGILFQRGERGVRRVGQVLFARGDDAVEPVLAEARLAA